ncbi:amino acid permease [candidate division KSB1 bacterium]|nr:amino acid permease [candidate division KSB1 bacterium]
MTKERYISTLERKLNLGHVVSIIVGTVIGSGVFITIPIVARETGSPLIAVTAWLIGGLIWIPQIFILSELGSAYPEEGFGYLYLKEAGSKPLAFLYVWTVFWTSDTPSITIIALSASSALSYFYPALDNTLMGKLFAAFIIISLTTVHYRDVKQGGNLQIFLTVAKISPLLLLIFGGLFYLNSGNLYAVPETTSGSGNIFTLIVAGVAATTWSYAGFPNVLYMAGEIKNPQRNLPKALISSVLGIMAAYVLISLASSAIVPHNALIAESGRFANPFQYLPGIAAIAGGFLAIAAFISMIGATNACIMVQPRIEYAIAKDGLFFPIFARVHPKFNTPYASILLQSGLAIILLFIGDIENLLGYFTLSYLLQNALVYVTIFKLKTKNNYNPTYKAPAWRLMAILSIAIQLYLAYGTFVAYPVGGVISAALLIATGLPIYLYFSKRHR